MEMKSKPNEDTLESSKQKIRSRTISTLELMALLVLTAFLFFTDVVPASWAVDAILATALTGFVHAVVTVLLGWVALIRH